jgi:hypothetical protein
MRNRSIEVNSRLFFQGARAMIDRMPICKCLPVTIAAALLTPIGALRAEEPKLEAGYTSAVAPRPEGRQYYVNATPFSLKPGDELATYHGYGSGGTSPGSTFGFGVNDHGRRFEVLVTGKLSSNRFGAVVKIIPEKEDGRTPAQDKEYDLSDLQPKSVELARDDDGRVYRLNLLPHIQEPPQPKQFKVRELNLDAWTFPASPVVINDEDYVGELSAGTGPIAEFEVPGLAKVEFSLLHLKNAAPYGTLQNGMVNIIHPNGTTVRISNVKNGTNAEVLGGGPYQVWVRWDKPRETLDEYHKTLKAMIAGMKDQAKKGELSLPPGSLERVKKISESSRAQLMEFGIRAAAPSDLADPAENP